MLEKHRIRPACVSVGAGTRAARVVEDMEKVVVEEEENIVFVETAAQHRRTPSCSDREEALAMVSQSICRLYRQLMPWKQQQIDSVVSVLQCRQNDRMLDVPFRQCTSFFSREQSTAKAR